MSRRGQERNIRLATSICFSVAAKTMIQLFAFHLLNGRIESASLPFCNEKYLQVSLGGSGIQAISFGNATALY